MQSWIRDFRWALRFLRRNLVVTLMATIALALGIGANTAIFNVVYSVLLRPLPYGEPERIVVVSEVREDGLQAEGLRLANLRDWRERTAVLDPIATVLPTHLNLWAGGEPERIRGARVSAGFFDILGVGAAMGRTFLAEEGEPGAPCAAVASHGLWERRFGGEENVLGTELFLDGEPCTLVGVMPSTFRFDHWQSQDLWLLKRFTPEEMANRDVFVHNAIGLLAPNVSRSRADAEMDRIAAQLAAEHPEQNDRWSVDLTPLSEAMRGPIQGTLWLILGAVTLILLVACANVAHLLLARQASRRGELALRHALGADRGDLTRQLLVESGLLALLGGGLGLLLAVFGADVLVSMSPVEIPGADTPGTHWWVFAFALLVSVVVGALVGILPAWSATRSDVRGALQEGGLKSGTGRRTHRFHDLLIVFESAVILVLLIGAGLMLHSFDRIFQIDPGFATDRRVTFEMEMPEARYPEGGEISAFLERVLANVERLPDVESVAAASNLPLSGGFWATHYFVEGRPVPEAGDRFYIDSETVSAGYFATMSIPLVRGRPFLPSDDAGAPDVAIVNEAMVEHAWPDGDPLGQLISFDTPTGPWRRIVGIVGDTRHQGLDGEAHPRMYVPHPQFVDKFAWHSIQIVAKTRLDDPLTAVPSIRRAILEVDQAQPIAEVRTYEDMMMGSVSKPRFLTVLLGSFAILALILGVVGLYGVVGYSVQQRRREVGIRMAMGADRAGILRALVWRGVIPVLCGVVLGLALAVGLSRLLESFLFGVSPTQPWIYAALSGLLVAVSVVAAYFPARRATRLDPVTVLRES